MSKIITQKAIDCFLNNQPKAFNNTIILTEDGTTKLFLFGNMIAKQNSDGLFITNAGWKTNTTRERLNGLPNVSISQRKGVWYLNGQQWDGKLNKIEQI